MTTQTASYLDAIAYLPAGATLILTEVPWKEYEQLLDDLGNSPGVRVSYDCGRLEIMSPSSSHEMFKDLLQDLARIAAESTGVDLESRGSTTFKQEQIAMGAEPDTCFYVQNAPRIIGKREIDLSVDPPPDVIVEIDVSRDSRKKFDFYRIIGVPELWRYDEHLAHIYRLTEEGYGEVSISHVLPLFTNEVLSRFLEQSKLEGQSATLRSFRDWLRTLR
ncbi:MAG: Uma2 family endonuclease [Pyrinomonadaceae bacterium]